MKEPRVDGPVWIWKQTHPQWGFLSQWYESPFHTGDGKTVYTTAEQYMMHQKALLFKDEETAAEIMATTDPRETQALGRRVENFDGRTWQEHRLQIVTEGLYFKYKHSLLKDRDIKAELLATGERELVEASPVDRIWGVRFAENKAEENRGKWGLNLLGKALTAARKQIREEGQGEKMTGDSRHI